MLNTVIIAGRITHEPEVRFFTKGAGGGSVTSFSIATHNDYNPEEAGFFDIAAFGKLAQIAEQNLHKGMMVYVKGYLRQKIYKRADGKRSNDISIIAERLYFQASKPVRESEPRVRTSEQPVRESEPPVQISEPIEQINENDMFIQTEIPDGEVPF